MVQPNEESNLPPLVDSADLAVAKEYLSARQMAVLFESADEGEHSSLNRAQRAIGHSPWIALCA